MEIRVLKYFLAVVRQGSISRAANFLHITQPTLSRQIMELEEELKVKLLIRGKKKLELTYEGKIFQKRAEEIITLVHRTELEFNKTEDVMGGDIYIGSGETEVMRLIARTAYEFQKEYPNVRYHIFSGNAEDVIEKLDKGLLDFGILIEPADIKKYDYIQIPATDIWGVLMRKNSVFASYKTIGPKELLTMPLIVSRQKLVNNAISRWLGESSHKLNVVGSYNLVFNASIMVEEGIGYALCLDRLINTSGHSNLIFVPLKPLVKAKLNIVWKRNQVFSKATEKFLLKIQKDFSDINN